jgi:SAM-dependent methyltransferase
MFYQLPLGGKSAMSYGLLADGLGLLHAAFVVFVTGGLAAILLGWRLGWRWTENLPFRVAHLAAIAVVVLQTWLGQLCPLTLWENRLRQLARQDGVGESFIAYWLDRLLYWQLPSWVFFAAYTIFGALVLATFVWYPPKRRTAIPHRHNGDVLRESVPLAGRRVLDVGCGDGALVRLMARDGARVVGVDNNPAQIAKAAAAPPAGGEAYAMAAGERLPFPSATFDSVVIFNALHHVPPNAQDAALVEAARVLKPGGRAYIAEPLAEGPNFELARLVDDETEVRAAAYGAIRAAIARGTFRDAGETVYVHAVIEKDFDSFAERMGRIDPARKPALERHQGELRERFRRLGRPDPKGTAFDQPMRVNLLVARANVQANARLTA